MDQLLARTVAGQGRGLLGGSGGSGGGILVGVLIGLDLGRVLLILVHGPIEDVVVLEALADEEITENLAKVTVVGLVVETQRTSVVQVDGELIGESAAQDLCRSRHLLLHDAVVLLLLSSRLQTLPGQRASAKVEHDIAEGLHIVTSRLLWRTVRTNARATFEG